MLYLKCESIYRILNDGLKFHPSRMVWLLDDFGICQLKIKQKPADGWQPLFQQISCMEAGFAFAFIHLADATYRSRGKTYFLKSIIVREVKKEGIFLAEINYKLYI